MISFKIYHDEFVDSTQNQIATFKRSTFFKALKLFLQNCILTNLNQASPINSSVFTTRVDLTCKPGMLKCFHIWKLVAIQKKTFYVLAMTLMFSIYDHCMDCMISYNCMALLWKPCFQVWPFYGNHVSKYDPFMETMFSSMALLWKPCFQV